MHAHIGVGKEIPPTTLAARAKLLREERELSQSELARRFSAVLGRNVPQGTIAHIEAGDTATLSGDILGAYCTVTRVHPLWLTHGKGPMKLRMASRTAVAELAWDGDDRREQPVEDPDDVPVRTWDYAAGSEKKPAAPGRSLPCRKPHSAQTYALDVRGDAMVAPAGVRHSFPAGSVIFADPARRTPESGTPILARLEGQRQVVFKIYMEDAGRRWLQSLNPAYPSIRATFKVVATVVSAWIDPL